MRIREQRKLYPGAVMLGLLGGLPHVALGQTTTVDVSGARSDTEVLEEVVIVGTGTSIRGIAPVGSEPIAYGRADIEADSPVDIRDALSNVPQIGNFGTDADQSTSNRFRTAGYQPIIHNLGIYSTLTLFNGHRMAEVGGEAVFPDPAILPTIAVERVDVIADGASAIYGSDAVAGVVNFIYRRGVDGVEVSMTEGIDPKTTWANRNIGALWGKQFDRGEMMVAYEYSKHDRPTQSEFEFTANGDQRSRGGTDQRQTNQNCEYPQVTYGTASYRGPNLTTATYSCNPDGPTHLASNGERHAALATARYKVADNVDLWSEINFSDYKAWAIANWGNGGRWTVVVPPSSPNYRVPASAPAIITPAPNQTNRGDGVGVFGHRKRITNSRVQGGTFGLDIDMGNEWQTSVLLHKSRTFDLIDDPGLDLQNLGTLLISGQFNPFNLTGNSEAVKRQINNGFTQLNDASQTLTELSVKLDGPMFEISGGDVLAAIGASHRTQRVQQLQTGGCISCSFYQIIRNDDIERGVGAVFAELAIPLVSASNAKPGIQKFTVSLAGRYDDYDGLDSQFNPKVGFDWTIINGLRFYGNWGTSYVAPNMGLITSIFGVPQPGISDRVGTSTVNSTLDIYNLGGGNPDLEPEEAESFSFGVNWSPEMVQGLSMGATYYEVEYSNLIYKPTRADVLRNPAFAASYVLGPQTGPNSYGALPAAYVAQLIAAAPPQTPITPAQTFNMSFNSFAINLGTRKHAGIDLNLQYDFDTSIGKWGLGVVANKQTKFDETVVPGSASFSRIGTGDAPPWAVSFRANWGATNIPLRLSLNSNYKSGYQDAGFAPTDSYLIHNFTVAYDFEQLFRGVTVQARVRNLLDEEPPFYNVAEGYDDDNHTPYGRQFDLTLRAKF